MAISPRRTTMQIRLELGNDYIRIGDHSPISRPENISRSRWRAFWHMVLIRQKTFIDVRTFLTRNIIEREGED